MCIGVGTDRANGVSDAATLRAVAELTAAAAFYGCVSLDAATGLLYRNCIEVQCVRLGSCDCAYGCAGGLWHALQLRCMYNPIVARRAWIVLNSVQTPPFAHAAAGN